MFDIFYSFNYTEFVVSLLLGMLFLPFFSIANEDKISFGNYEFIFIIFLAFFSGLLLIGSSDFIFFFLCLELFSILSFTLIIKVRSSTNAEASFKYLVFASIASIALLFFFFLSFFSNGLNNIYLVSITAIFFEYFSNILFVFLVISFMIKYGIFPFHSWVPDVYQASSTSLFTFFTTFSKVFLLLPFLKIFVGVTVDNFVVFFVVVTSFFGIFFATVLGFQQLTFRRLFAYSSVSNASLIFLLFANINKNTISVILNFTFVYVFITAVILALVSFYRRRSTFGDVIFIPEFHNNPESSFFISAFLATNIFFLSGLPPFGLFFPKVWIFRDFFFYHPQFFLMIAFIFFFTLLNIFYYCRIVQYVLSFSTFEKPVIGNTINSKINNYSWYVCFLFTFIIMFFPYYFNKSFSIIINTF